jgi:hypothetical protein
MIIKLNLRGRQRKHGIFFSSLDQIFFHQRITDAWVAQFVFLGQGTKDLSRFVVCCLPGEVKAVGSKKWAVSSRQKTTRGIHESLSRAARGGQV